MTLSTEQIADLMLIAFKEEYDHQHQNRLNCRLENQVLAPAKAKHRLLDADVNAALRLLGRRKLIERYQRGEDGYFSVPSASGLEYLASKQSEVKAEEKEAFTRRFQVWPVVVAILAIAVTVILWLFS